MPRPPAALLLVLLLLILLAPALTRADTTAADRAGTSPPRGLSERISALDDGDTHPAGRWISAFGFVAFIAIAWLAGTPRRRPFPWRVVVWGAALQILFAVLVLKTGPGRASFEIMNTIMVKLLGFTEEGARFIFGNLVRQNVPVGNPAGDPTMGPIPPGAETGWAAAGGYFAFNVLPTIIFFSSLMSVLYYVKIMPLLVRAMAWVMSRTMGTSGAESLASSINIFVGQTEAPLAIRPYVPTMTLSELHAVMVGGFANVAGGVMAAYVGMLSGHFPDIAGHLIAASVMSAPASLVTAKLFLPETEVPETRGKGTREVKDDAVNLIDAATRGAGDGLRLALNVAAMLLAFIALVAMVNALFGALGGLVGAPGIRLEELLGYAFWPVAWLMGVPAGECALVGRLLGERMVLNEFISYLDLAGMLEQGAPLSGRGVTIATYALCGFANLGSIAIQIGGIGAIAENRRHDLARIGFRAMIAGSVATFMSGAVAGMLL